MAPPAPATDAATRGEALQLADEHGAAEASRRTGLPAGTIPPAHQCRPARSRRRIKVIGRFPGETSALSLIWAVLELSSCG